MTTILRTRLLSSVIFFLLIASAVFTVPARADSGSPPPTPTGAGGTGTTQHTAAQGASGVTNTAGGGHTVELGSQVAAHVSAAGDPVWCPSSLGVPTPGAHTCSANYANMALLVAYLTSNQKTVDGTIWINGGGPDASGPNTLDGSSAFATMALHKLTFKGGWTGVGGVINTLNPSIFANTLEIDGWTRDITLSDVQFNNNITGFGRGLLITTMGNITLTRVQTDNDLGIGAFLDNTSGTGTVAILNSQFNNDASFYDLHSLEVHSNNVVNLTNVVAIKSLGVLIDNSTASNKAVTIKASLFDNNNTNGLFVSSKGPITLTNVSASGNGGYGALLDNSTSITVAPVTLTGTNNFDFNGGYGLTVISSGKITSSSLNVNNNGANGADLINISAVTAQPITLTGSSSFSGNGVEGLDMISNGIITANNLFVVGNGTYGAGLDNHYSINSPLKVTGTSLIANNGHSGLYIDSNGAISLNNISAIGNGTAGSYDGLYAENYLYSSLLTPQPITLTGTNTFNMNTGNGAELLATGKVTVNNVTALGNVLLTGLTIQNDYLGSLMPQSVTLLGHNALTYNYSDNLDVSTYGNIMVNNLTASNSLNGGGAYLGKGSSTPGNVTLIGLNTFNLNANTGLKILSMGAVVTNGLNANANFGWGVNIDNHSSTTPAPVTLKGVNTFNQDFNGGLIIHSGGSVLISSLTVTSNGGVGAAIDNSLSKISSPVSIKGLSTFNFNAGDGLFIASNGTVLTSGLNVLSNDLYGALIDNTFSLTAAPVVLNGKNTFNNNHQYGLEIYSNGVITTNNLNASYNGADGVYLKNNFLGDSAGIKVNGRNVILDNTHGDGIDVYSNGPVTLANISANWNYYDGLRVDSPVSVLVSCGNFLSNGTGHTPDGYGWETGGSVPSIKLIGVTTLGNYSGDYLKGNPLTSRINISLPCILP